MYPRANKFQQSSLPNYQEMWRPSNGAPHSGRKGTSPQCPPFQINLLVTFKFFLFFSFVHVLVVIKPENLYFASRSGLEVKP